MADNMEQKVAAVTETQRMEGKTNGNAEDSQHAVVTTNDSTGRRTEEETAFYSDFGNGSHNRNNFAGDVVNNSGYTVGNVNGSIIYGGTGSREAEVGSSDGNGVHSWRNFGNGNYNCNNFGGLLVNNSGYAVGNGNGSIIHGNFDASSMRK